jgi:hypothetical protein
MKIKHYSIFNGNYDHLNWSQLRNTESEIHYYLPYSKEEYLQKVDVEFPTKVIQEIINFSKKNGIKKILSIGSGIAANEYCLKKFSEIPVVITDYDKSILRLKNFNIFDDVLNLDALNDLLPVDNNTLVIFSRIDTEFDDADLIKLFHSCQSFGVPYIWFIPAELISLKILLAELKIFLISIIFNKKRLFCGYARSKKYFIKIWSNFYKIKTKLSNNSFILINN